MKLRNKKTGAVGELHYDPYKEYHFTVATKDPADMAIYRTLAKLNADWKDYEPKEPLIKDEKVRKAVRAWADVLNIMYADVEHDGEDCRFYSGFCDLSIEFDTTMVNVEDGIYTITELCGEGEE